MVTKTTDRASDHQICTSKDMALRSEIRHNICAHLSSSSKLGQEFEDIIAFLRRSRIAYAISTHYDSYRDVQQEFWDNADIDCEVSPTVIRSKINNQDVVISAEHLRRVLQIRDQEDDPIFIHPGIVKGCFLRMKYNGNLGKGTLRKAFLCPKFKYLAHVVVQCLGGRKAGYDAMNEQIQAAVVALTLNLPFNFSEMIFCNLKKNITDKGSQKFLMYPRFLQMVIDSQISVTKKLIEKIKFDHMKDTTLSKMKTFRDQPPDKWPVVRRLFGHLSNENYVAPHGVRWRHAESDSDIEDIKVLVHDPDVDAEDVDDEDTPDVHVPMILDSNEVISAESTKSTDSDKLIPDSPKSTEKLSLFRSHVYKDTRKGKRKQVEEDDSVHDADYIPETEKSIEKSGKVVASKSKVVKRKLAKDLAYPKGKGKLGKKVKYSVKVSTPAKTVSQTAAATISSSSPATQATQAAAATLSTLATQHISSTDVFAQVMKMFEPSRGQTQSQTTSSPHNLSPLPSVYTPRLQGDLPALPSDVQGIISNLVDTIMQMNATALKEKDENNQRFLQFMECQKNTSLELAVTRDDLFKLKLEKKEDSLKIVKLEEDVVKLIKERKEDSLKIIKLEDENVKLQTQVQELSGKIPEPGSNTNKGCFKRKLITRQ